MKQNQNKLDEVSVSPADVFKFLNNIIDSHFQGKNGEILQNILSRFSFESPDQVFSKILDYVRKQTGDNEMNFSNIEQIDMVSLGKDLIKDVEDKGLAIEMSEEEAKNFEQALKNFSLSSLHDIAFPLMVAESPQIAASAKNLITRTIDSLQNEGIDVSDVYDELDIENLPTEFSLDLLMKLGGRIPGIELIIPPLEIHSEIVGNDSIVDDAVIVEETEVLNEGTEKKNVPTIVYTELTDAQALFLSIILKDTYKAITSVNQFHGLLKSKGNYESVRVKNLGLILSIIFVLHRRKTELSEIRYLSTNGHNAFWPFFQQHLIDASSRKPFERDLTKLREENNREDEAEQIIDDVLRPENQAKNLKYVKEYLTKEIK